MRTTLIAAVIAVMALGHANARDARILDAIDQGDLPRFRALLTDVTDLNAVRDRLSFTPLALAAVKGEADFVEGLLEAGADPDAPAMSGLTPLALAIRSCRADPRIVGMLVAAGADIDARSGAGLSPVQVAIQFGRNDIAALLIALGADIQAVNLYRDGVLNYAIYYQTPEIIQLALRNRVRTDQLSVLFTTSRYYQMDFGPGGLGARQDLCSR